MALLDRFRRAAPPPVDARHAEWSVVASADDLAPAPGELVDLLLEAGRIARLVDLSELEARSGEEAARYVRTWPGEHYRLLPALAAAFGARHAVEIGTYRGHGTLALLAAIPADGSFVTYDLEPWGAVEGTVLRAEDFGSRLEQRLANVVGEESLERELPVLARADLIFLDGPKDGIFEPEFARVVLPRLRDRRRLVVVDDTRLLSMVGLWRELDYPKLDATSLGHWSGTGLLLTR
jgi:predicted O-methyltransferase YrrM